MGLEDSGSSGESAVDERSFGVQLSSRTISVLAIDPGVTTGWALVSVWEAFLTSCGLLEARDTWISGQLTGTENSQVLALMAIIRRYPGVAVVVEDFVLRVMRQDRELLSPVRITAALEYAIFNERAKCRVTDRNMPGRNMAFATGVFKQSPGDAMNVCTDERLKMWGYYRKQGAEQHARDATRHALLFLRRAKGSPELAASAWPTLVEDGRI